jgi:hypothetical protein
MSTMPELSTDSGSPRIPLKWYAIWLRAFTRPTVRNFKYLLGEPKATFGRAFRWVILADIASGLIS